MEYIKGPLNSGLKDYQPNEYEAEKASGSYIMSLVSLTAGLPLPIVNLITTIIFFLANKKGTYYIRWHCTQALLSQFSVFFINSFATWWTILIIFGSLIVTNSYIAYLITILIFNATEFIATIDASVKTRKGVHVEWWFYGNLTNIICRKDYEESRS
jgi:hypothetical protein